MKIIFKRLSTQEMINRGITKTWYINLKLLVIAAAGFFIEFAYSF